MTFPSNYFRRWTIIDRRVRAIFISAVAALLLTAFLVLIRWWNGYSFSWDRFWEPVFASWVAGTGLLLFTVMIAVIQLTDPSKAEFSERLRILVQGKSGPHIDYFMNKFSSLEHYADSAERKIVVKNFDSGRFDVEIHSDIIVRNFIDDLPSTYYHQIKLEGDPENNARLAYLRINGEPFRLSDTKNEKFTMDYPVAVEPSSSSRIEFGLYRWAENEFSFTPARFTRSLSVTLENELDSDLILKGVGIATDRVTSGGKRQIFSISNIEPKTSPPAYTFTLEIAAPEV